LGKTETIKERTIWVYLPTLEQKQQLEKIANEKGTSLSKWIIKTIEDTLKESEGVVKSRGETEKENKNLRKEIAELQNNLRQITIIRDNLEKEIRKYRTEPFLTMSFEGIRQYDKELITLLKNAKSVEGKNRFIDNDEILSRLGVTHMETEVIKSISNQLSRLEEYGLVESGTKGWRWKE
jgi:transposase-like protein